MSTQIAEIIISLGCGVAVPVGITALIAQAQMHRISKRAEVIMTAIEKNPEMDIKAFMGKSQQHAKSIKERLMNRLTMGLICLAVGLGLLTTCIYGGLTRSWEAINGGLVVTCSVSIMLGLALILAFVIGRRMFRQEIEKGAENAQTQE